MKYIRVILFLMILLTGCQGDFLETSPQDGIGGNDFWETEKHAELGVTAIYNVLRERAYYNEMGMDDAISPIAYRYGGNTNWDIFELYSIVSGNSTGRTLLYKNRWEAIYLGVNRANDAIVHIPDIEFFDNSKKYRLLAEAKFLRALFYFDLLNFYGGQDDLNDGGVPIYLEPMNFKDSYKPRSKPSEVRYVIIQDLVDAINILPDIGTKRSDGRASKGAALTLLGKTYLYNKEWEKAANAFQQVIQSGDYELSADYYGLFQLYGESNKEIIFALENAAIEGYGGWLDLRYGNASSKSNAKNSSIPTNFLVESYRWKDGTKFNRQTFLSEFETETSRGFDWTKKEDVDQMFNNRDPRLEANIIRPFALFVGAGNRTYEYRYPMDNQKTPLVQYECMRTVNNTNNHYCWRKFVNVGEESPIRRHSPINYPIMRYADVLLMFAEARNESDGNYASNASDSLYWAINKVRQRVGMPNVELASQQEIRKIIREERMVELAGEGVYYQDFRRWNRDTDFDLNALNETIYDFTGNNKIDSRRPSPGYFLWPIPTTEIELNSKLLPQNPGW